MEERASVEPERHPPLQGLISPMLITWPGDTSGLETEQALSITLSNEVGVVLH